MEKETTKIDKIISPRQSEAGEGKNDYESKQLERERVRKQEHRRAKMGRIKKLLIRRAVWILILAGLVYGVFLLAKTSGPDGEDLSIRYDIQGQDHVADGTTHPPYNSNPPSSGWHYASPARGGFYEEPLPDERIIHNLEHGDVWIAYRADINDEAKDILESLAGRYVVVSPRLENEGDISLVAWGRVDTFNVENEVVDEERIHDFIGRYDNRGPEKVRGIQTGY